MKKLSGTQKDRQFSPEDLTLWSARDEGLQRRTMLVSIALLSVFGLLLLIISYIDTSELNPGGLALVVGMGLFLVLGSNKKYQFWVAVAIVAYLLLFTTLAGILGFGPSIYVLTSFMLSIILANSLVSIQMGIGSVAFIVIATIVMLTVDISSLNVMDQQQVTLANTFGSTANIVMSALILVSHTRQLELRWEQIRQYAGALNNQNRHLQADVEHQDVELVRRSRYLNATAAVARDSAATLTDVAQLMQQIVNTISQQLDFYHVGIFLIDNENVWAELRAASSDGGKGMVASHHRLRVGSQGIVGYVAQTGRPRIAEQVTEDTVHLVNPNLPDTRSEVAVPLVVRGSTLGVLDVQSDKTNAFTEQDIGVLQALADLVAVTVMGANMLADIRTEVADTTSTHEIDVAQSWRELLRSGEHKAFVADEYALSAVELATRPGMQESFATGDTVIKQAEDAPDSIAIPIRVRGEVIGVINGRKKDEAETWSEDDISLLQALTDQLNIALQGAQLYEDSQQRAVRERLVREVTNQMRSAVTWEELLQIAVQQMADTVQVPRAFVQWVPPEEMENDAETAVDVGEEAPNA